MATSYDPTDYNDAYQSLIQQLQGLHSDSAPAEQVVKGRLDSAVSQFQSSFYNLVGRQPTDDETNQFLQQNASSTISNANGGNGQSEKDPQSVLNSINQFVGQNFQQAANQYATQQLTDQQTQANSLGDLYQQQGDAAINTTQQSLFDYQSKLFDQLKPNLLTSLKSQGLLDTGGLNDAIAGVQGDLANNASNYIAQLQLQNTQGANQIRFGGAAAPYQYQQNLITQQPGQLATAGSNAATFNNSTFMDNLNYQHQLGLVGAQTQAQASLQPSFLRSFGQSAANSLGQNFNFNQGSGGGGGAAGTTSLLLSNRNAKKDITKLTKKEEDAIYDKLMAMPLSRWRYNTEAVSTNRHLGVITDEALPEIINPEGTHLNAVDYLGVLTLALKVQHRRMVK